MTSGGISSEAAAAAAATSDPRGADKEEMLRARIQVRPPRTSKATGMAQVRRRARRRRGVSDGERSSRAGATSESASKTQMTSPLAISRPALRASLLPRLGRLRRVTTRIGKRDQSVMQSAIERLVASGLTEDEIRRLFENELTSLLAGKIGG